MRAHSKRKLSSRPGLSWFVTFFGLLAAYLLGTSSAVAASAQDSAFENAARAFQDGAWERAERGFGEYLLRFPKAGKRPEALLYQAEARYKQGNFDGVFELLLPNLEFSGRWSDQYYFWVAEATFSKGDFKAAAEGYAQMIRLHPRSTNLLAAAYGEALSRYRLKDLDAVVKLLGDGTGVFQTASARKPDDETAVRGNLLLAEAHLEKKQFAEGEKSLEKINANLANPELAWRRQYMLARLQRADQKPDVALESTARLITLSPPTKQAELQAIATAMRAEILEQLKRLKDAADTYAGNLTNAPAKYQREAMLKIIDLNRAQNEVTNTLSLLDLFIKQNPGDPALDVAHLTAGELKLRQFYDAVGPAATNDDVTAFGANTNLLEAAITNFNGVLGDFEKGERAGRAYLDRGWARWHLGRRAESLPDFAQAAQRLPVSEDQAVARFKLGEAQLLQKDYTNAIDSFQQVITNYGQFARVKTNLYDLALYKIVRAGVEGGNMEAANGAVKRILEWYPESFFSDRSLLVYGQALNYRGSPGEARTQFRAFLNRFPEAPLASELWLAIARTYIQEENWGAAARLYDDWVRRYAGNSNLAQAEYDRAWVTWKSGDDTNAVAMMTNLVARFPNDANAPLAQRSIADFYFNRGQYTRAEENYQLLFQNTNTPPALSFPARLWAGRAACARLAFADARGYFLGMINSADCPTNLLAEAYFWLGDTWIEDLSSDPLKPQDKFGEANKAYGKITQSYPTTRLAALAWGKIGGGHLQLARQDPNRYEQAALAYTNALTHAEADFWVRGLAEIGLGTVFEKQGKVPQALEHYLNVVYFDESKLKPGERPALALVKEAGLAAGRILEEQQQWDRAVKMYERLQEMLPNLRTDLRGRIDRVELKRKAV